MTPYEGFLFYDGYCSLLKNRPGGIITHPARKFNLIREYRLSFHKNRPGGVDFKFNNFIFSGVFRLILFLRDFDFIFQTFLFVPTFLLRTD